MFGASPPMVNVSCEPDVFGAGRFGTRVADAKLFMEIGEVEYLSS